MPVFVIGTYDEDGTPNAMTAAWGGISNDTEISICVARDHLTVDNILERKCFTVSMGTAETVRACDCIGLVSGRKVKDKVSRAGLTAEPSGEIDAPSFRELPVCVECTLKSWNPETERLVGDIRNVAVDEDCLDEDGRPDLKRIRPITFDEFSKSYIELGDKVGTAFRDGRELL